MNKKILLVLAVLALCLGCQSAKADWVQHQGYRYYHHDNGSWYYQSGPQYAPRWLLWDGYTWVIVSSPLAYSSPAYSYYNPGYSYYPYYNNYYWRGGRRWYDGDRDGRPGDSMPGGGKKPPAGGGTTGGGKKSQP